MSETVFYNAKNLVDVGNVGIGTPSPGYKLHVDNTTVSGINTFLQASGIGANDSTSFLIGKATTTNNSAVLRWNHLADGSATNFLGIGYYGGDNKLNITAGGTVGIGTTNPAAALDVYTGTANAASIIASTAHNTSGAGVYQVAGTTVIDASRNLTNIGTISSGAGTLTATPAAAANVLTVRGSSTQGNVVQFSNTTATGMFIMTNGGRIGINTTIPGSALDVYGATSTTAASTTIGCISNSGGSMTINAGGATSNIFFATNGVGRTYHNSTLLSPLLDNNIGLGNTATKWSVVWVTGGVVNGSDARQKTNIAPTNLGLNFINRLNPVSYKWKVGQNIVDDNGVVNAIPGKRTFYGFLAQEVKQALDDMNAGDFAGWVLSDINDPESAQAIRYTEFVAPITKAIQELSAKNTALEQSLANATANVISLEAKLETAQNDIDLLESRLAAIEALIGTNTSADTGTTSSGTRVDALLSQV